MDEDRHEEIARGLFRESNDALFLFDTETHRVLDLNPVALRLTGYVKDQARALGVWDLFSGDAPASLDRFIEAYRRTGFYHSREGFHLARRDGLRIPVNVSVSRIHTRPSPMGLVVARDVSERKKAEEALRESERRYRSLVESARVIFWTVGPDRLITSLNSQFTVVTGLPVEDWVGRPFADLFLANQRDSAIGLLTPSVSGDPIPAKDFHMRSRDGTPVILEFLVASSPCSKPTDGVSGIARDVTEVRRAEEAIYRTEALEREKLAAVMADRSKSEFLAHFSHEIRTPLTSILGFTDVLLEDDDVAKLPPGRLEDLRVIRQSGTHLLAIINDILDLSQIEAGRVAVTLAPCAYMRVVEEVVSSLSVKAEVKGLSLLTEAHAPLPKMIRTDSLRLRQILMNLVGNAIKFTEKGRVTIRIANENVSEDPMLRIDVVDTGCGLSSQQQSHLFEPFYRASSSAPDGSGLGLSISRRLADRLGGRLAAESELGNGSVFRLFLPIDPEYRENTAPETYSAKVETPLKPSSASSQAINGRILLAEDNASIQRVTAFQLEKAGAAVSLARNGQEAIDAMLVSMREGCPYDVVLMDMQMPVVDGYEATRQLRALGFSGIIIALTAYAMAEDREECLRLGCDDHLSKPIDWARLNERITTLVADRNARPNRANAAEQGAS